MAGAGFATHHAPWRGMLRMMIQVLRADEVEATVGQLPVGTVVVVCDPDADRAAEVAGRVNGFRTAVFVGDISVEAERVAAEELGAELEAGLR